MLTRLTELRRKEASVFLVPFRLQTLSMMQRKIYLPSRELTKDNEHRNKNQEEDQESCWESPLEAKTGVWKFKDQHLRFIPT